MPRIVFFGEPGSGKTTVAKLVARHFGCDVIEASEAVIFPVARYCRRLPKEESLLESLEMLAKRKREPVSREDALATFLKMREKYSADFVARALHRRFVSGMISGDLVFSGVRGLENAKYCRLHNDFLVYLDAPKNELAARLIRDRGYSRSRAIGELKKENETYRTRAVKGVANLVIDTSANSLMRTVSRICSAVEKSSRMCKRCVNSAKNPAIAIGRDGYCQICRSYLKNFDGDRLKDEVKFLKSFRRSGSGKYDVMVGVSGGKDSTATLYSMIKLGFRSLAFTFDLGYLPETTVRRSKEITRRLGTDHEVIDIRKYVREIDRKSYEKTVRLYERPFDLETKAAFKKEYGRGRKHYSIKCKHSPTFVRTCQLCRRMVIRAYFGEAQKRKISAVVLGINEWTNLSAAQSGRFYVSGMRKLQPNKKMPPVYVFHLPFLLRRNSRDTKRILDSLGWEPPKGEDFIESNSNSCLFARSTERMAKRLLEFHPDSTRLAREVTVGFITKKQALKALGKIHPYKHSPRQVLERAGILGRR